MGDVLHTLARRGRRLLRQLRGRDLWTRPQVRVAGAFLGSDYGGWCVCPARLDASSIIYTVGVGQDVTFDLELIRRYGATVHAFDPTPVSAQWVSRQQFPPQFQFHQIGLAGFDGMAGFLAPPKEGWTSFAFDGVAAAAAKAAPTRARIQAPVKRLTTLMRELGHDHLDLLKMDIEGAEYDVIRDLAAHPMPVTQLLVEFHHGEFGHALDDTRQAINALNALGLRIFRISPTGLEYSFIKA